MERPSMKGRVEERRVPARAGDGASGPASSITRSRGYPPFFLSSFPRPDCPRAVSHARTPARLFAGLVLGGLGILAAFNWLVNPWGLYAPRLIAVRVVN